MKTIIPPTPILGTLDVLKVIDFFDEPLLYLAEGQDKTKWLCILIDQNDENNIWYAAQLSPKDVRHLLRGELDLFTVYSQSHDGYVIEVTLNRDTNDFISEQELQSNSVNKSLLPDPGDALRGNISDLHDIESPVDIKAAQTDRTLLRLDINFPQGYVGEAPIKVLGDLFTKLQDLLDAFAQAIFGEPTKKGPIPNEYRNKAKMNLVAIGSGSFELDLASKENSELFGFQDSSDIIDKFMQIVKLSDSEELFKEEIAKLEIRAAGKYLSFLETLRDN